MIPTRYKSKLPQTLSWPIGAEAISQTLEAMPNGHDFELAFYFDSSANSQRALREKETYTLVTADFQPARKPGFGGANAYIDEGWYDQRWEIRVSPVLRKLRHLAGCLLREKGLPSIIEWLQASETNGWEQRQHSLHLNDRA